MKTTCGLLIFAMVMIILTSCAVVPESSFTDGVTSNYKTSIQREGGDSITVNIPSSEFLQNCKKIAVFQIEKEEFDIKSLAKNFFGVSDPSQLEYKKHADIQNGMETWSNGQITLINDLKDFGLRVVISTNNDTGSPIKVSAEQALNLAKSYLLEKGLITETEWNQSRLEIQTLTAQRIDVNDGDSNDDAGSIIPTEYIVKVSRAINGLNIKGSGDGITVFIGKNGISWVSRKWGKFVKLNKEADIISAQEMIDMLPAMIRNTEIKDNDFTELNLIYYPVNNLTTIMLIPAWELKSQNDAYSFDASNGKLITG